MDKDDYEDIVFEVLSDGESRQMLSIEELASLNFKGASFNYMEVRHAVWRLLNIGILQMDAKLHISLKN